MTVTMIDNAGDAQVADWVAERIAHALAAGGPVAITVPGGSTPFPILELLAGKSLDWRRVTVWPGDDRVVPEDHPASNAGRIRALLEPAGAEVVSLTEMEQVPHFALAWLGMGADGHVASLFPNTDPRADDPLSIDRLSLTIAALVDSDALMFVIRGSGKRGVFEAAAAGESDLPVARLLGAAKGEVTCFT
jgi:6-phosphogluconolactonase